METKQVTPPVVLNGTAMWAVLHEPKSYSEQDSNFFVDWENGAYFMQVVIPKGEAESVIKILHAARQREFDAEVKKNPKLKAQLRMREVFDLEYDDEGKETGNVIFKPKLRAKVFSKAKNKTFEFAPVIVDAKRNPLPDRVLIGNGSKVKVRVEPRAYVMKSTKEVGVTLGLRGVQVLELVSYTPGTASAEDMFEEEDGFEIKDSDLPLASASDLTQAPNLNDELDDELPF